MHGNAPSVDTRGLLLPDPPSGAPGTAKTRRRKTTKRPAEPEPGSTEWWDRWSRRNHAPLRSDDHYDVWRCTACGAPLMYAKRSGHRGGPFQRTLDRRYGTATCWRVSEGGWRLVSDYPHGRGERVLVRHDSRPQSAQPEQDSSVRHLTGESPSSPASYGVAPGARRARFTRTISVGATVRVPCVEPRGSVLVIAPASTDTGPSSSKAMSPTQMS
jgi:hypothetical protein